MKVCGLSTARWSVNALPEISVQGLGRSVPMWTRFCCEALHNGRNVDRGGVAGDAFVPASASGETANLEYTYEDTNGCANGATLVAELVAPLEMDLGPKLHACEGTGFFWLPTPEGLSGFWSGPGLVNNATGEVDLNALVPAAYAFAFTHEDEVCTSTAEVEMEVHAKPVVELTSTPVSCVDSLLTMSAAIGSGTAPFSYVWAIGGDTLVTAEPSYAASWEQPGFIDFALEVTDAWGCANATSWVAEVQPPASVAFVAEMDLCNQAIPVDLMQSVQPESEGNSNFYGLDLAFDAVTASGLLSPELLPIGNHAVVYQFEPDNGCAFRDTIALAVGEAVSVEAGLDVSACFGPGMLNLPSENGAVSVQWSASTALPTRPSSMRLLACMQANGRRHARICRFCGRRNVCFVGLTCGRNPGFASIGTPCVGDDVQQRLCSAAGSMACRRNLARPGRIQRSIRSRRVGHG